MSHRVLIGREVADQVAELKKKVAVSSTHPGLLDSASLCRHQVSASSLGFTEAEIVRSNYGFSLRYASGLCNFGLIRSARNREVDGTFEGALAAAEEWVSQNPTRRWVTTSEDMT